MTLACDDAKSKLVGVVTVADVDVEKLLADFVWCRFGSRSLVIKSNFRSDFEHKVWSRF